MFRIQNLRLLMAVAFLLLSACTEKVPPNITAFSKAEFGIDTATVIAAKTAQTNEFSDVKE